MKFVKLYFSIMRDWMVQVIHLELREMKFFLKQKFLQLQMFLMQWTLIDNIDQNIQIDAILNELTSNEGILYDPKVVDALIELYNENKLI